LFIALSTVIECNVMMALSPLTKLPNNHETCDDAAGYIGSLSFLNTVLRVVEKLRAVNPKLIYGEPQKRMYSLMRHCLLPTNTSKNLQFVS
jgi:hypothetical protein